jgi:hypothetical protein
MGFIHGGETSGAFAQSLALTALHDRLEQRIGHILHVESSPRISEGRSQLVDGFLHHTRDEWLLMVDSDMQWEPQAFLTVYEAAHETHAPIVGGLCFAGGRSWAGGKPTIYPTLYQFEQHGDTIFPKPMEAYPRNELVQVGATGAAFLMVHRKVFLHLQKELGTQGGYPNPYPWFAEVVYKGHAMGEDITFCYRAGCLNYPIYVHTGAHVGHRKSMVLDEGMFDEVQR